MKNQNLGLSSGLISGFFWAVNAAFLGYIYLDNVLPKSLNEIVALSFFIAFFHDFSSAIIVYIYKVKTYKPFKSFSFKKHYLLVFSGVLAGPIGLTCYMQSIQYLGVGLTTSTVAIYPVVITIILIAFFNKKVTRIAFASIILTVIGCIGVNFFSFEMNANDSVYLGGLFSIVCVITWSFESIVIDRLSNDNETNSDLMFFIRQVSSAFFYLIILVVFFDISDIFLFLFEINYILLIVITSFFATISYLFWYKSISIIGAPIATLLNVTYSFWGVLFGVLFFHQEVNIYIIISLLIMFMGIALLMLQNKFKILSSVK